MPQIHPYKSLCLPSDALFSLNPSPGKGWGAFATRPIRSGTIILTEDPLFVVLKPHEKISEHDVWTAVQGLEPSKKQQFTYLRDNALTPFRHLTDAFAENSFTLAATDHPQRSDCSAWGLFILHSRFNHSCIPNAKIPVTTTGYTRKMFATKDIDIHEEILFCYETDFECRKRDDRHRILRFVCNCKACSVDTPFQQLSDMRRTLIRGAQYLTLGADLDGRPQSFGPSIIINSSLKKAAENYTIPLSARLIYNLLTMALLEEEGLLDFLMIERMKPGISQTVAWFQSEDNAKIAELAIAQKTWAEKFGFALRLDGRNDVADNVVAQLLRQLMEISLNAI